ncbi:HAD family hydrolase [Pseudobacteroides cellulosolvens]|uniref:HAD-superfamily hydrolase, subfamily IA, variant 1 n=1 Tax=Pseudobacteroides cellulosolvens ATCC 35603 = DSM 2933 TaxID=398512 RepID=A0A0L6JSG3_9FIRM|nr:HAD family hydrolase [Pseudobacteroides cellulosolvens]KNY28766.1 HAD-superfamily hydrolase, subfamily IA, variant 1 [Pseudobacteroides cellulosolvens ATCC 35603 = DSM 2933]
MSYKAVLFDLDGTLLDTIKDISQSMNYAMQKNGLPVYAIEEYKYLVGEGVYNLAKKALPEHLQNEETINCIVAQMKEHYEKHWADNTVLYEGIPELLNYLTSKGYKLSILSNKPHSFTQKIADKLLDKWQFDVIFGERKPIPIKPDPASALEIASIMGVNPQDFLYLGDTSVDMYTANNAGMYAVGVTWGFRKKDELLKSGAKLIINHPMKLSQIC